MDGKVIFSMIAGAALGMYVASKNRKVRKAVSDAEEVVMSKIAQTSNGGQQSACSNQQ